MSCTTIHYSVLKKEETRPKPPTASRRWWIGGCYFPLVFNFVFLSKQILWVMENDGGAAASGLEGLWSGERRLGLARTCMVASLADRTHRSLSKSWSRSLTARRSCRSSLSFSSRAENFSSITRCKESKALSTGGSPNYHRYSLRSQM